MAIYDFPFYQLKYKEMKLLLPMLAVTQKQQFLLAGGFLPLTFEVFGGVIRAAFANCLVIQKFLQGS